MNQTNARFGNAFTLETERLYLVALTAPQLGLWLENASLLEEQLQCRYGGQELEGFFRRIVSGQLPAVRQAGDAHLWHTFWWIIDKKDGEAVGTIDFKNPPNNRGETEIGYGLGKNRRGRGLYDKNSAGTVYLGAGAARYAAYPCRNRADQYGVAKCTAPMWVCPFSVG